MFKYIITISLYCLVFSIPCFSIPDITGDGGQAVTDGGSFTITGSGFGTNALNIESTSANIEAGIIGGKFTKTGWTVSNTTTSYTGTIYTSGQAHSGTKSLLADFNVDTQYLGAYMYDTGGNINSLYVTWWMYVDLNGDSGQFKVFRIRPDANVNDIRGEVMFSQWYFSNETPNNILTYTNCASSADATLNAQCYPDAYSDVYGTNKIPANQWVRVEVFGTESSDAGAKDGTYEIYVHTQNQVPQLINKNSRDWTDNIMTRATGITSQWRYIVWQNYWGNDVTAQNGEKIYQDDHFIQIGTKARVELGNAATLAASTHREIQKPTSWADGSITFTLNRGSFGATDSVYLYVIDSTGSVNASGYPITFGDEGGEEPPPDTTAPIITGQTPLPNATGIAKNTNIEFTCSDGYSNCDASTINFTVNGVAWITNGVINETYATGTVGADGTTVAVSLNPVADFTQLQLVTCVLTVDDTAASPNSGGGTWQFRVKQDDVPNRNANFKYSSDAARIRR
jgi:hypothetical protein